LEKAFEFVEFFSVPGVVEQTQNNLFTDVYCSCRNQKWFVVRRGNGANAIFSTIFFLATPSRSQRSIKESHL